MKKSRIMTAVVMVGLIALTQLDVMDRLTPSVQAITNAKKTHKRSKKHDKHVYIIQVTKRNTYAYCTPSTNHRRGRIYLRKNSRLHVYNTISKRHQVFYEIKSHRYVLADDVRIIE